MSVWQLAGDCCRSLCRKIPSGICCLGWSMTPLSPSVRPCCRSTPCPRWDRFSSCFFCCSPLALFRGVGFRPLGGYYVLEGWGADDSLLSLLGWWILSTCWCNLGVLGGGGGGGPDHWMTGWCDHLRRRRGETYSLFGGVEGRTQLTSDVAFVWQPNFEKLERVVEEAKKKQQKEKDKARLGFHSLDGTPNSASRNSECICVVVLFRMGTKQCYFCLY